MKMKTTAKKGLMEEQRVSEQTAKIQVRTTAV
jgi:hypothetical protein